MVEKPLVSIIMNCHNGESYLREAIDSIYVQTYENWEIIFWDNESIDDSAKIAKSYDKKLRYFKSQGLTKLGFARNRALEKCKGKYIAFLDTDDIWVSNKLELQIKKMIENPKSIVCYSDGYDFYQNTNVKRRIGSSKNIKFYAGDIFKKLIVSNFINWQTVLINKKMSKEELYFNEELSFSEDHELLLRLSLLGNFVYCLTPLIFYRIHDKNISHNYKLILKETEIIFKNFNSQIKEKKIDLKHIKSKLYGSITNSLVINRNKDFKKFIKFLIKYPNFQNVLMYVLLKLNMTFLVRLLNKVYYIIFK